ncbi:MAG: IS5 family transposase [Burkholderiaceae bacterium]|nr:IS5 family transposase [Burkholderiaceae bacterium]
MRGFESNQEGLFSYVSPEARVPAGHPLRAIRIYADEALRRMSRVFNQMYADGGRLSVPPETLLKSSLLMALYSVRSERLFCEMLEYNLLFRWFLAMGIDDAVFDHSTFSKNRQRLLAHRVAPRFLGMIVRMARRKGLVSDEHFSVDGTLIDAWASMKSVRPKDGGDGGVGGGNPAVDFKGQRRRNDTHASTTDAEAQLARKGKGRESRLAYAGHALMENRNGLVLGLAVTPPNDNAEVKAAEALLAEQKRQGIEPDSLGADKGYCQRGFVEGLRGRGIEPHIALIEGRRLPGMDGRTTGSKGYAVSQRLRKRIEECFGWLHTIGGTKKVKVRGRARVEMTFVLAGCALNLMRIAKLAPP